MPGSSAASHPADAVADFIPPFPPEIWTEIFRHLDINCLLNIAEAVPDLKELAFRPTFLDRVVFNAETDVRTIGKFVRARRQTLVYDRWIEIVPISLYVNELHFTNTVSLSSDAILHCTRHCSHLRELYCVNCVVEPAELFHVLSLKAMYVTKLEWSLYDERCYKSKLDSRSVRLINALESSPMLKYMYVEYVTTPATEEILSSFLRRCSMLRHRQIHQVGQRQRLVPSAGVYRRFLVPLVRLVPQVLRSYLSSL